MGTPKRHKCNNRATFLTQPCPELLESVLWHILRPHFSVQSSLAAPDIGVGRVDGLGALEDLPEAEKKGKDQDADVSGEEVSDALVVPRSLSED